MVFAAPVLQQPMSFIGAFDYTSVPETSSSRQSVNCGNSYGDNGFNFRQSLLFLQDCKHNSKIIKGIVILFFHLYSKVSSFNE
jgi:hypothetical protein